MRRRMPRAFRASTRSACGTRPPIISTSVSASIRQRDRSLSLADPAMPDALRLRGNTGIYGVADQMIWRAGDRAINVFLRGGVAPSDRNLMSAYVDGGVGIKGLFDGTARRSADARRRAWPDRLACARARSGHARYSTVRPIRSAITRRLFEVSYIARLTPWWSIQPDLQYIVHPGGRVSNPLDPTRVLGNTFIAGVRTTINF